MTGQTARLMRQTARRQQLAKFGDRFRICALTASAVYLLLLVCSRLLALFPNWFAPGTLAAIPAAAALAAMLLTRRLSAREVARLIDQRTGGKELFLTAALVESSDGAFKPIVIAEAEGRAAKTAARDVVPFHWLPGARDVLLAFAVLSAAILYLPQLDPFGKEQRRQSVARQEEHLRELRQATALRIEQIAQQPKTGEQVNRALAELEKTFKEAKPQEREANLRRLSEQQKELGEMWRKVSNELPRDAFDKAAQQFGTVDAAKLKEMRQELRKGDISAIKKELSSIREQMREVAAMRDSAEKSEAQRKLAGQLGALAEMLRQEVNSPALNAALARALEQLEASKLSQLAQQAMQGAQEALELGEQELRALAEAMKSMQSLEDALKNLQMARQLANLGRLDGEACKACEGMSDYAALYARLLAEGGDPNAIGPGMGPNPGRGQGGKAPEDETAKTDFTPEKTNTALSGGKMLMQWKVNEVGETGARAEEYRGNIRALKEGISEAIAAERVPPGYHSAIQKYFDSLPEK